MIEEKVCFKIYLKSKAGMLDSAIYTNNDMMIVSGHTSAFPKIVAL